MGKIDDLLQRIEDGDTDAIAELRAARQEELATTRAEAERAKRDLRLAKDQELRELYPRALRAYEKGRMALPDDFSDEALKAALKDKEEELAELGVPVGTEVATPAAGDDKPGAGFGEPQGAQSPGGNPRNLVQEYLEAMKGTTKHDQAKANRILVEMNQLAKTDMTMRENIKFITSALEAPPISVGTF